MFDDHRTERSGYRNRMIAMPTRVMVMVSWAYNAKIVQFRRLPNLSLRRHLLVELLTP